MIRFSSIKIYTASGLYFFIKGRKR